MPRVLVESFVGPSNTLRSTNVDTERTVNWYLESTQPGNAKAPVYFAPVPGLVPFVDTGLTPSGFDILFYQNARLFFIIGSTFGELNFFAQTWTNHGTVTMPSDEAPASIVSNGTAGNQLLIVSGTDGYVFDLLTNTLTEITTGNFPGTGFPVGLALMCEYMDGYGIVVQVVSRKFFFSALNDFTDWDPLDVAERSEASDNFVGVKRRLRELVFFGNQTSEVWYNSGDALNPFAPVPGTFIETGAGLVAFVRIESTVAFVTMDSRGWGQVSLLDGYIPKPVSTNAVATSLDSTTTVDTSRLFVYQQQGHTFLWVIPPGLKTSWVWDYTLDRWHERAIWNIDSAQYERALPIDHAFAFEQHFVITRDSGVIYNLELSAYTDSVVMP